MFIVILLNITNQPASQPDTQMENNNAFKLLVVTVYNEVCVCVCVLANSWHKHFSNNLQQLFIFNRILWLFRGYFLPNSNKKMIVRSPDYTL